MLKKFFMPALNSTDSLKALLQHKARVQRTLSESFAALTAAGTWDALNESLLKECVKALNAQAAFIIVPKENELRVVAADDLINALFQDTDYAALKDAASIAIQRHKNLLFAESPEKRAGGRSMICVPVFSGEGKPLAVLGVFGRDGGGAFTEADAEVLTAVALSAGAAIEKIGLKIELALKYKEIEFMNRINRYTTSIRDLRELLEAVLGEMTKALGAEMGVVLLKESETAKKFEVAGATDVARKEFEHTSFELPKTLAIDAVKSIETKRLKKVNNIISSALLQPVAEDGVVVGVFALFNKRGGESEYFTVEDALLFASLVKQAHSALFQE
ncbi:GAF domain-containing protein, partial [Candidatus Micrarchaeota archaeon]|nr:GAF domain-containing protein [Candidatus Micrarchaeota archaeon]